MFTTLMCLITYVAGTMFNKLVCSKLHKKPASPARDFALHALNGGPGHLPQ